MPELTGWAAFVANVAETENTNEIAKTTGINQSTIYRWLHAQGEPKPVHAARFAQTYGVDVLLAFVAAGWITDEQAKVTPEIVRPVEHMTVEGIAVQVNRLVTELINRSDEGLRGGRPTDGELAEARLWWQHNDDDMHDDGVVADLAARDEDRD